MGGHQLGKECPPCLIKYVKLFSEAYIYRAWVVESGDHSYHRVSYYQVVMRSMRSDWQSLNTKYWYSAASVKILSRYQHRKG